MGSQRNARLILHIKAGKAVIAQVTDAGYLRSFGLKTIANEIRPPVPVADNSDTNQDTST